MSGKPIVVMGTALKIIARYGLNDSYGNEVKDLMHYEVFKRSDDGKMSIIPTGKPLTEVIL